MRKYAYHFAFASLAVAAGFILMGMFGFQAADLVRGDDTQSAEQVHRDSDPHPEKSTRKARTLDAKTEGAMAAPGGAYGFKGGSATYALLFGGSTWADCTIRYIVNTDNAPAGALEDFQVALAKMDSVFDGQLVYGGTTSAVDQDWEFSNRDVLVNFGVAGHGVLSEDAAGTASPVVDGGTITGAQITFSTDHDHLYPGRTFGDYGTRIALYMHEIGHSLGLTHVDDADQLMYESVGFVRDLGAGDIAGLRAAAPAGC